VSSSFTCYRDRGFWSRDSSLELWLFLLAQEVKQLDNPSDWLCVAAEDWQIQATGGFVGCISAGLDEFVSTPDRAATLVELSKQALATLHKKGEVLTAEWLNSLSLSGTGSYFMRDVPTEVVLRIGDAFVRLLCGEITWDAKTSPVL